GVSASASANRHASCGVIWPRDSAPPPRWATAAGAGWVARMISVLMAPALCWIGGGGRRSPRGEVREAAAGAACASPGGWGLRARAGLGVGLELAEAVGDGLG